MFYTCSLVLALLLPAARTLAATATVTVGTCENDEAGICVTGPGAEVTLPMIRAQLSSAQAGLLVPGPNGVWQLNASLFIDQDVTLRLMSATVRELRLRSEASDFVVLSTENGTIDIDGVKIYSWDPAASTFDMDVSNGRSHVRAKFDARMDIKNSEMSYLGALQSQGYGVSWVDTDDGSPTRRTRVTGTALNTQFHHNYYGIYLFQAANMTFRGNKFHHNIVYGFDPHDYSHHVLVEDNEAFENGNHGFIISRGCNNFTFRRNSSYNNRYTVTADPKLAHGFMLDPGSPSFPKPQAESFDNLLEDNRAWGNSGYGLRILGSRDNIVRNNVFDGNLQGITVEQESKGKEPQRATGNVLTGNTITGSRLHGIFVRGAADETTITGNTVTGSGVNGIYIKSNNNLVTDNTTSANGSLASGLPSGSGIVLLPETTNPAAAAEDFRLPNGRMATGDAELVEAVPAASGPTANQIRDNAVTRNVEHGIELKGTLDTVVTGNDVEGNGVHGIYLANGASRSLIQQNTVKGNAEFGIRANGTTTARNTWSENSVFINGFGGITATSGANNGIQPPTLQRTGLVVTGRTTPGAIVEIFSDTSQQAQYFEGRTTAGTDGTFTFRATRPWRASTINATATDEAGNSSGLTISSPPIIPSIDFTVYLPLVRR